MFRPPNNRRHSFRFFGGLVLAGAVCSHAAAQSTVELRGSEAPLTGRLVTMTDAGIELVLESGERRVLSWDRVRSLRGDGATDGDYPRLQAKGERLWRARTRLERGDARQAELLFEEVFESTRHATHETALVTAEGLLRCRLRRGDQIRAVAPALEVIRLRRAGVMTDSFANLPPVIDAVLPLVPELPPVWMTTASGIRLAEELREWIESPDPVVSGLAALYREAALGAARDAEMAAAGPFAPRLGSRGVREDDHAGRRALVLVHAVAQARFGPGEGLPESRAVLEEIRDHPESRPLERQWSVFALGLLMARSDDAEERLEGAVHLLALPASSSRDVPFVAGYALALVRELRRREGRSTEAEILERELGDRFPGHPVRQRGAGIEHLLPSISTTDSGDSA